MIWINKMPHNTQITNDHLIFIASVFMIMKPFSANSFWSLICSTWIRLDEHHPFNSTYCTFHSNIAQKPFSRLNLLPQSLWSLWWEEKCTGFFKCTVYCLMLLRWKNHTQFSWMTLLNWWTKWRNQHEIGKKMSFDCVHNTTNCIQTKVKLQAEEEEEEDKKNKL